MTTFLLIRHGHTDAVGRVLVGRTPGIDLSPQGREQARELVDRLAGMPLDAIFSSPIDRALQTAAPLAASRRLEVQIRPDLTEVDGGNHTGREFEELRRDPGWERLNSFRSGNRIPGGEAGWELAARAAGAVAEIRSRHATGTVALFSHGDPIRAALSWYAGIHLDLMPRLRIDPASVSILQVEDWGPVLLRLNDTGTLADALARRNPRQ